MGWPGSTTKQENPSKKKKKQAVRPIQTPYEVDFQKNGYVHKGGSSLIRDLKIRGKDFDFLIKAD